MKIAVIAKVTNPIGQPFAGGLESFTYTMCKAYMDQGHEVTLYANANSDTIFDVMHFNDAGLFRGDFSDQYESDEYIKIMEHIDTQSFDIIHDNSTHHIPVLCGARMSIPMVSTLHTPAYSSLKAIVALASYSNNINFIAVSKSLKKIWQPYIHTDVAVIHNGIVLGDWSFGETRLPYLYWYGRIIPNKGLDLALEAAKEVGLPLKFAGPITNQEYFDTVIRPGVRDEDEYLGHLRQDEINDSMKHAQALVNSARWEEPFGLSTVEAMASGTPVVGFDRGALREIIQSSGGVIAEGTTVRSLVEAIKKAMQLSSSDVAAVSEAFDIKRCANQYLTYFKELI